MCFFITSVQYYLHSTTTNIHIDWPKSRLPLATQIYVRLVAPGPVVLGKIVQHAPWCLGLEIDTSSSLSMNKKCEKNVLG